MSFARPDGSIHLFEPGGRYVDQLMRSDAGWRIAVPTMMQDWVWVTVPPELTGEDAPEDPTM